MRRAGALAAVAGIALAVSSCGGAGAATRADASTRALASARTAGSTNAVASARAVAAASGSTFAPEPGHVLAGFSIDRDWLALAEDPAAQGACPEVVLVHVINGHSWPLTTPTGPTCQLGGTFWVRPGARAIGNALLRALWIVRNGTAAIAVKGSPTQPETVLEKATGITDATGPFLGPVVAKRWLRLFGHYTVASNGTLSGGVTSGNNRELWSAIGPVLPLGLDDDEHIVSVGAAGSIAMWHAHGARYGKVPDAHARTAALDDGEVLILRSDRPQLDIRLLSGQLVASWPVAANAAPLLSADVASGVAVYAAGRSVHELRLGSGRDVVVAQAPAGSTLIDAQVEPGYLAYAYRGGPGGAGKVVVLSR